MKDLKILLVEDSRITRQLVHFALKDRPHIHVTEASDGVDGLAKAARDRFGLLIVDINMPMMDGLTMVKEVRKMAGYRDVPVLIISVETHEDIQKAARELGVNAYICKPTRTMDIADAVEKVVGVDRFAPGSKAGPSRPSAWGDG